MAESMIGRRRGWRRWAWGAASVLVHAALLGALVVATEEETGAAVAEGAEEVTYVDISSFPPPPPAPAQAAPEEPRPTPQQPTQPPVSRPRPAPQTPPRAADIVEPTPPDSLEPLGQEAPLAPVAPPVAQGPPAGAVSPVPRAGGVEGGVEGGREGGQVGAGPPPEGGTFVEAVVDRRAELRNRRDLPRIMERLYPDGLKRAGIGGRVVVQFVVDTNGRIDMSTVQVMSAEHDGLVDPTVRALREFRFSAARMGDRSVRMLTQMPIIWQVEN